MIHYQLRCAADHAFDGWFKDSAGFDQLCARDLVECPHCGSLQVSRALMAPAIATRRARPAMLEAAAEAAAEPGGQNAGRVPAVDQNAGPAAGQAVAPAAAPGSTEPDAAERRVPDRVRAMLQRMRAVVERNCDYVGPEFAQEARRIHQGEIAPRGIYGETTADEAEALADDGIEVARIPWVPRAEG